MSAVKAIHALTAPVEDYLKAIFEIEIADAGPGAEHAGVAGTNEIAQALGIAPASVTGMLRRLADQELISYERYRGVRLTDAGRRAALRTIRRHRVIEDAGRVPQREAIPPGARHGHRRLSRGKKQRTGEEPCRGCR